MIETTTLRVCGVCREALPLTAFHRRGPGKWHPKCAKCRSETRPKKDWPKESPEDKRRRRLKAKYGITPERYEQMEAEQGGRCAVCSEDPGYPLVIDHCHATGNVRALLCTPCNLRVGMYETYGELVAAYVGRFKN